MGGMEKQERYSFDLKFIKRFLRLLQLMFPAWKSLAVILCIFLLGLSLLEQVIIYNIGLIPSKYYKVLGTKDKEGFKNQTIIAVLLILAEAFIKSSILYVGGVLYIAWRGNLSKALHSLYFKDTLYYQMNNIDKTVDNPDQRITQDVDKLCNQFSLILIPLIISPFLIGYYIYQAAKSTGYLGPVSVFVFFIVATVINKFLMSPVVRYFYYQEEKEGDFRFKHMQLRVNAESAAFYSCGTIEEKKTNEKLQSLLSVQHKLIQREYLLNFSIKAADYLGSILSYVAIAVPIFLGTYDGIKPADLSALISKNAFVTIYLISCFTTLIDLSTKLTDVAGAAHRNTERGILKFIVYEEKVKEISGRFTRLNDTWITVIGQLLETLGTLLDQQNEHYGFVQTVGEDQVIPPAEEELVEASDLQSGIAAFRVDNLTYGPPKSSVILCRNLSFQLECGVNVLVTGDSGCGKSSLLRVINRLWPSVTGHIDSFLPAEPKNILYLPQKPYFTNGSLREQIMFPLTDEHFVPGDEKMYEYLDKVGLKGVVERTGGLDAGQNWNWYNELSPGEMQRLSFVRLFYHKPAFAILDEATCQVNHNMEDILYTFCAELNITVLSVGHRSSVRKYHDLELQLDGVGGWSLTPITDNVINP